MVLGGRYPLERDGLPIQASAEFVAHVRKTAKWLSLCIPRPHRYVVRLLQCCRGRTFAVVVVVALLSGILGVVMALHVVVSLRCRLLGMRMAVPVRSRRLHVWSAFRWVLG